MSEILGWIIGIMLAFAFICIATWAPMVAYKLIARARQAERLRADEDL